MVPSPNPPHPHPPQGRVAELEPELLKLDAVVAASTSGISHTRWATHGAASTVNSHPHCSADGRIMVVHNGIIENYSSLKAALLEAGYPGFKSQTDSEMLVALAQTIIERCAPIANDPTAVVRDVLAKVEGTYGLVWSFASHPDMLIACRKGSPLCIGVGEGEHWVSSDAAAFIAHTRKCEFLGEGEMATITRTGYSVSEIAAAGTPRGVLLRPVVYRPNNSSTLDLSLEAIEKGGYAHFMLKEIMSQPACIENALRGRISASGELNLGGLAGEPMQRLTTARRIIIAACGTSFHSGQVGEYLIESLARVPVEVEYASEFRYKNPILFPTGKGEGDVLIVISQSGETADTIAAVREAKKAGVMTLGIVNVVGSTIARETDAGIYLHVGPEIGVASTKAFTGQVTVLAMLAIAIARERGTLSPEEVSIRAKHVLGVPALMERVLAQAGSIQTLANGYRYASSFLFLGRGFNYPVAMEGALKLKEIADGIHAEGYAAAEMKHGPIALIDRHMPVVFLMPSSDPFYNKIRSNYEEVLARGGSVIVITDEDNKEIDTDKRPDAVIKVPASPDWLTPLLTVIPCQLMAYHIAVFRKCTVDLPRNLAKSVTVE